MTEYIYNSQGKAVGFICGKYIHSMNGNAVGQLHGTHVHRLSGQYIGELYESMILNKHMGNLGNIGNPGTLVIPVDQAILVIGVQAIMAFQMSQCIYLTSRHDINR